MTSRTATPAALPVVTPRIGTPSSPPASVAVAAVALTLPSPTPGEQAALDEAADLSRDERLRVLIVARRVATADAWQILDVPRGTDKKTIKRAYFRLSKELHPDRFFKKQCGSFAERLAANFEAVTRAYQELTEGKPRASTADTQAASQEPQTPAEYAAELFDRACLAEVSSELASAMKLFAAAVKLDPLARYLRRAASCALAAGELQAALDHARKATALEPSDPSIARTLARALRALERLDDAEEVLVMALAMKNENDTLSSELAADLGVVRAALARR